MPKPLSRAIDILGQALDRFGIIDTERFRPTTDLAFPRIVTGFAIMLKQTTDLAMVGIAIGTLGTAGLAFAFAFWGLVTRFGLGLAGGTVSLVSQSYGGGKQDRASLVVKQSVIIAIAFGLPITGVFIVFSTELIDLLSANQRSLRYGSVYLVYVAPAVTFELLNLIASRTYTGVGDSFTEMVARSGGAFLNILLNAILIFGFGLGVVGAAIGTSVSSAFVTLVLGWGMLGRRYGTLSRGSRTFGLQPSPVPVSLGGRWIDLELAKQLLEIAVPEIARKLAEAIIVFPLLWIAATFGPLVVAAFEVSRRVRGLITSVNWGLSLASSALVGQHLGSGREEEAAAYGAAIIRLSTLIHAGLAVFVIFFAAQVASLFVTTQNEVARTTIFVTFGALSAIGFGLDGAATGALLGAGDTRWPFIASLLGRYAFALPVAALGLITPLGITVLYVALILESFVPGGINYWLFRTGRWKRVSRRYRSTDGTD